MCPHTDKETSILRKSGVKVRRENRTANFKLNRKCIKYLSLINCLVIPIGFVVFMLIKNDTLKQIIGASIAIEFLLSFNIRIVLYSLLKCPFCRKGYYVGILGNIWPLSRKCLHCGKIIN